MSCIKDRLEGYVVGATCGVLAVARTSGACPGLDDCRVPFIDAAKLGPQLLSAGGIQDEGASGGRAGLFRRTARLTIWPLPLKLAVITDHLGEQQRLLGTEPASRRLLGDRKAA
jgi:hypothetical protein